MALLGPEEQKIVKERLAGLTREVEMVLFTNSSRLLVGGQEPCMYCQETEQLMRELEPLSDQLSLVVHDLATLEGKEAAREAGVDTAPTLILREKGSTSTNLRYLGIPAGYEFSSLLEDLEMIGGEGHGLAPDVVSMLQSLAEEVKMQVFVTPTCPYCPAAVRTAHRFAYASPKVLGEMVEAQEFPQLASRYQISGVPDTIINGRERVLGAQPLPVFLEAVEKVSKGA